MSKFVVTVDRDAIARNQQAGQPLVPPLLLWKDGALQGRYWEIDGFKTTKEHAPFEPSNGASYSVWYELPSAPRNKK